MSCGTCGIQASDTMQGDTGVPAGAPTSTARARCPHCRAFIAQEGAPCRNPRCPGPAAGAPALPPAAQALQVALQSGPADDTRAGACQDPACAVAYARQVDKGPRDDTRQAACQSPSYAMAYALHVDQGPRTDTRAAACQDPAWAYFYAQGVDRAARADTRQAACRDPHEAFRYALDIDQSPREDTRAAACRDAEQALQYALWVDQGPHTLTRIAARSSPEQAEIYAAQVDKGPRDDTRQSACQVPVSALFYALRVDQGARDDTRAAACRKAETALRYAQEVDRTPRDDTRKAAGRSRSCQERYAAWELSLARDAEAPPATAAVQPDLATLRAQHGGALPFFSPEGTTLVYTTQAGKHLCAPCAAAHEAEAAAWGKHTDPVTGYMVWGADRAAVTYCASCTYAFHPLMPLPKLRAEHGGRLPLTTGDGESYMYYTQNGYVYCGNCAEQAAARAWAAGTAEDDPVNRYLVCQAERGEGNECEGCGYEFTNGEEYEEEDEE